MLELKPDNEVQPSFGTYCCTFDGDNGKTEVWVCKSSQYAGIDQVSDLPGARAEEHIIMLSKDDLLKMKALIDQAVKILEEEC